MCVQFFMKARDNLVQDLTYRLTTCVLLRNHVHCIVTLCRYSNVFRGCDFVTWLVSEGLASDRQAAVTIGRSARVAQSCRASHVCRHLLSGRALHHVVHEHHFHDTGYFYEFSRSYSDTIEGCGITASCPKCDRMCRRTC